ncbi:MAG: VWA domain-containing protein [Ruminococcus sp.]|jgi:hypothetical protein|nr:VWA domain-containing protein [Ruminococcus sp.]
MDDNNKITNHLDHVNNLADKMLAPETEEVIVKKTVRDLAADIDIYSDVDPLTDEQDYFVSEYITHDDYEADSPIVAKDKITYSGEDKRRLLHDLGADRDTYELEYGRKTEIVINRNEKRIEPAELAARELEERERIEAEKLHIPKASVRKKRVPDAETIRAGRSMIIITLVILAALYVTSFFYVRAVNAADVEDARNALLSVNTHQIINTITKTDSTVSASDKEKYDLSVYKLDTDEDGLTDHYEMLYSGTAPAKFDTDGDGVPDGIEYMAGTDPIRRQSDTHTEDSERTFIYSMSLGPAMVRATGKWDIYKSNLTKYPMNVENYPGILSPGIEITLNENNPRGFLYYDLTKVNLTKWGENPDVKIFRYNPETGTMSIAGGGGTISDDDAIITLQVRTGIYFLADRNFLSADSGVNIMFVIDNSGSMYSDEIVADSEENDLEFKRLDFAEQLIERIGENVNFGVGKFTLKYSTLSPITDDDEAACSALESIRTGSENFDGTEISNSIISAVNAFEDYHSDRNYIIAITDGLPTNANSGTEERAISYAKDNNVSVITIGLGKKIDSEFLSRIAEETGGVYYQAVNNGTFDSISEKVETLVNSGRTEFIGINANEADMPVVGTEESISGELGVIVLADSGFVENEDMLSVNDIPTVYDRFGSDLGLAAFASAYYSGTLPLKADGYVTNSNTNVPGYDLTGSEFFTSGKQNLSEVLLPDTAGYDAYKKLTDRWDFNNIFDGILPLSDLSVSALKPLEGKYQILTANYDWGGGRDIPGFLRAITFQPQRIFTNYEYPAFDIDALPADTDEYRTWRAVNYYNNFADKGGVQWLSFSIDGLDAYDEIYNQLTLGIPSVLIADGKPYIAAKLSRSQEDANMLFIEAYDPNDVNEHPVYINLKATELLYNSMPYQYTASISGTEVSLYIMKTQGE